MTFTLMTEVPSRLGVRGWLRRCCAVSLLAIGIALTWLGVMLALDGGSVYYVTAGLALLVCAALLWRDWLRGASAYGLFFAATTVWALYEAGLDGWALAPRLGLFGVIGLVILLSRPAWGATRGGLLAGVAMLSSVVWLGFGTSAGLAVSSVSGIAAQAATEWPYFGADQSGTRFAPAAALTAANVSQLRPAWIYKLPADPRRVGAGFESVPLKIGDRLYFCSSFNHVTALDAETGREVWRHEDPVRMAGLKRGECRGVAYYHAPQPLAHCTDRVLYSTIDARLIALDSTDGRPCPDFGNHGEVDLLEGMGAVIPGYYAPTSPPLITQGKAIINGRVPDGQFVGEPSGVIRAFDAVTGRLAWAYDAGRPHEHGLPPSGQSYTRDTPNSWGPMSADDALGLIYVPIGNSTPDYWSGYRRTFDNELASSVIALDVETGERRWNFQTTHLDIWDYDVGSQPVLTDFVTGGRIVPALIQPTKRGEIFVLDRRTGTPLTQVTERPVPQAHVPGEISAPTQPFSVGFPSVAGPPLIEAMMWGLTPIDQALCRIMFRKARYEGPLTPVGTDRYSIVYPGYYGGVNWGSVTIDHSRQIMVVLSEHVANYDRLLSRAETRRRGIVVQMPGKPDVRGYSVPQEGTPYGADISPFLSPLGVPCQQPPFSTLSAIDLRSRKIMWTISLGSAERLGPMGIASHLPFRIGTPFMGGAMTTQGGLTFVAGTTDRTIRAVATASGAVLWQAHLPENGQSVPISYVSGASGRQFVVISAGGLLGSTGKSGDYLVAFAPPAGRAP